MRLTIVKQPRIHHSWRPGFHDLFSSPGEFPREPMILSTASLFTDISYVGLSVPIRSSSLLLILKQWQEQIVNHGTELIKI